MIPAAVLVPGIPHKTTLRAFCWVSDLSAEQRDGGAEEGPSSFAPSCLIRALPLKGPGCRRSTWGLWSSWQLVEGYFCLFSYLHRYISGGGFVQVWIKCRKVSLKRGQPLCFTGYGRCFHYEENIGVTVKSANVLLSATLQVHLVGIILPHVYTGSYHKFGGKYFRLQWDFWVSCPNSWKVTSFVTLALGGCHSIRDRKTIS